VERALPAKGPWAERLHRERQVVVRIKDMPRTEGLRVWREKPGQSEAALYRRLAELDGFSDGEK
jgi:hypothetical protein